ncbi:MAG: cell envelope integrity protein TolA, partial [Pasteurellaceae bacterium]|nr:cell envelope integrity protein TolA [Pasteurellaceae bacterium]
EQEAKAKAEREAKLKAEQEAKAKAKRKAAQDAEAKAEQAIRQKALDDFFSGGNVAYDGKVGQGQGHYAEGDAYGQRIKRLIQSKYRVDPSFTGKACEVRIILSRDGTITNYQVLKGDKIVCDAAVSAIVATRKVPPAPSDAVYQRYKSPILDFGLKVN